MFRLVNQSVSMTIEDTPQLTRDGSVNEKFIKDLIRHFKNEKKLSTSTARKILKESKELFASQSSLVDLRLKEDETLIIVGDIHGQFFDLIHLLEKFGLPNEKRKYLFNGDIVDRGAWGVEAALLIFSLSLLNPSVVHVGRGNHEWDEMNKLYGFENEVLSKYESKTYDCFKEAFDWMPLAHLVSEKVLVVHGGISKNIRLDDIRSIERGPCLSIGKGLAADLLWSDPQEENGMESNSRGFGVTFGPDVTDKFLLENSLRYIVRSHECMEYGYDTTHDDKVITVFSAPNYCDKEGNKGAVVLISGDDIEYPDFKKFTASPHPPVDPNIYSSVFLKLGLI
uniref:protein-serine/threonine phosphatase n=1 Tax=Lepeophtheirus salmonis TaxID=72036 RepID=A0A0K2TVH7_LEPSM